VIPDTATWMAPVFNADGTPVFNADGTLMYREVTGPNPDKPLWEPLPWNQG
jgi:hypothetical protein